MDKSGTYVKVEELRLQCGKARIALMAKRKRDLEWDEEYKRICKDKDLPYMWLGPTIAQKGLMLVDKLLALCDLTDSSVWITSDDAHELAKWTERLTK